MSSQPEKIKPKININAPSIQAPQARAPAQKRGKQDSSWQGKTQSGSKQRFSHPHTPSKMSKSAPLIQRELKQILPQINAEQRQDIAHQLLKQLQEKGVQKPTLKQTLALSTLDPAGMNSEEISEVAVYAYQYYPDVFEAVLTQRHVVQFLSSPILSAIVGIMAAKWLNP